MPCPPTWRESGQHFIIKLVTAVVCCVVFYGLLDLAWFGLETFYFIKEDF